MENAQNNIFMKYIFSEKCFTLKQCQNQSHKYKQVVFQIWGWQKNEYDFIWVQYQTFSLDEVHFTFISNVVILSGQVNKQYKFDLFF